MREIRLESYGPRHALVILLYNIVCMFCKPVYVYTSWFSAQLHDNKTHVPYSTYYTPKEGFTANDALFYMYKGKGS